jgi:hypothetical protein
MKTIRFSLKIPESELLKFYAGDARNVFATDSTGKTVQFPAEALRPFITRGGVYGRFIMHVDDNYKLIKLEREADL